MLPLPVLSYASGIAAGNPDCGHGPIHLQQYLSQTPLAKQLLWQPSIQANPSTLTDANKRAEVLRMNQALATQASELTKTQQPFLTLGGDHSCAIGTWSGVISTQPARRPSLFWLDAHLDSHTPESSPSGNIHGMPLAALLGYGDPDFTGLASKETKLKPEEVIVYGARSYEPAEWELLHDIGVRIYQATEIKQRGLATTLQEALGQLLEVNSTLGFSIDLDGFDPEDVPSVGTPVSEGIAVQAFCETLQQLLKQTQAIVAAEITEYNPMLDPDKRGARVVQQLIQTLLGYWETAN